MIREIDRYEKNERYESARTSHRGHRVYGDEILLVVLGVLSNNHRNTTRKELLRTSSVSRESLILYAPNRLSKRFEFAI